MINLLKLETGNIEQTNRDEIELIRGVEYFKSELNETEKDVVRYLYAMASKYLLTHRPLDKLSEPHVALKMPAPEHTILRPELAVVTNGQTFPDWIVEIATSDNEENPYLLKTNLYAAAGVKEYWIVNPEKKVIMIYMFEKNGLMPVIHETPKRIKVGIYKDFYLSYSEIFKERIEAD
ncbi:MAG: Uma2 family endonuclease [Eubacterium sp.]